jgi:hypothetical protein
MAILVHWIEAEGLGEADRLFPIRCPAGVKFLRRWKTPFRGMQRTVLTHLQERRRAASRDPGNV